MQLLNAKGAGVELGSSGAKLGARTGFQELGGKQKESASELQ